MNEQLYEIVKYARENVPFYRNLYNERNVDVRMFQDIEYFTRNFRGLPIVQKDLYIETDYLTISDQCHDDLKKKRLISVPTSGSTGKCLKVYWNQSDYRKSLLPLWMLRKKRYGITPKDKACFFFTNQYVDNCVDICGDIIINENHMLISKSNWNESRLKTILHEMIKFEPKWMILQPSIAQLLCIYIEKNNIKFPNSLKYIESSGEILSLSVRNTIKKTFKCLVFDQYGTNEVNAIAYECRCGNMHVLKNCNHVEILNNNATCMYGEEGNIYVTSLSNFAMPFIRYETGDTGVLLPSNQCECGCDSPILKLTNGRNNDLVFNKDGTKIHSYIFVKVIEIINDITDDMIKQFQVVQKSYECFVVKLVIVNDSELNEVEKSMICKLFLDNLSQSTLSGSQFVFEFNDTLLPSETTGKLRYFINEIIQ